jgi:hypothetical protein
VMMQPLVAFLTTSVMLILDPSGLFSVAVHAGL